VRRVLDGAHTSDKASNGKAGVPGVSFASATLTAAVSVVHIQQQDGGLREGEEVSNELVVPILLISVVLVYARKSP